jgi:hypothetical protein
VTEEQERPDMNEIDCTWILAAIHEARGALQTIASQDNLVCNTITKLDVAADKLRASVVKS